MTSATYGSFFSRHVGPQPEQAAEMLKTIGVASLDELIDQTVPKRIRLKKPLKTGDGETEHEFLTRLKGIAAKNKIFKSFIGLGYFDTITPSVILRCVLENPSWYTPYTPYQAEIAQGRLEALLNFQTMVKDLTGMDVANASLLDEATAAAEAMAMLHRMHGRASRKGEAANTFFVSDKVNPQTLAVLESRAAPIGISVKTGQFRSFEFDASVFGALIQNPDADGNVSDIRNFIDRAHGAGVKVAVATDLLACTIITPPGEMGADVVFGSAQRFGVPMGFGGPHAAFFATRNEFVREMPGRIIGVSIDRLGNPAFRMSLQTREQHIRRDKAKSNICTAQALLANIAGFYGTYHGPHGLRAIATRVHSFARVLDTAVRSLGARQENPYFFDTVKFILPYGVTAASPSRDGEPPSLHTLALKAKMNFRYEGSDTVIISLDETTTADDVAEVVGIFAAALGQPAPELCVTSAAAKIELNYHVDLTRSSFFMTHPVFNSHHSETEMMRYLKMLEKKDLGLDVAMIPLGSCTMKLNAATEMIPVTWPEFGKLHPFAPADQAKGYAQICKELESALAKVTGFAAVSLQPNAGSQGEYAGLMAIRAYHASRNESHRTICLIPSSAHGTNPASAVMAGFEVVVVACDKEGHVDLADLKTKAEANKDKLAALMVTYPSTYGVFEEGIVDICKIVHANGGQVYMDGANMNAQVGLTSPGFIGADVCHLNLHKTFAIPHGGGGPGMGPIGVAKHLAPFLPGHPVVTTGGEQAIHAVSAAPFGSASILLISYGYISMLGGDGMTEATKYAILNANYVKARLENHFEVTFVGTQGRVAHEMIFDLRPLKEKSGVDETDVAKRLMDYGFHAPTVSWPVPGTMMIEPTESEPKCELDRFCDAMISIRGEIQAVINGEADKLDNPLKNAPHTATEICSDGWKHAYSRESAAFPSPATRASKFWPSVARIDNTHGDKNLVCSCPDISNYAAQPAAANA
jgi:glycine dehydrogenase